MTTHGEKHAAVAAGHASKHAGQDPDVTTNLFVTEDLGDNGKTIRLAERDLNALHAVADWITTSVARPHRDLGRSGAVCPFVPQALEHKTLWLAPERTAGRSMADLAGVANDYRRLLLNARPGEGSDVDDRSIVVVFTDLQPDRAKDFFDDLLQRLGVPSYEEDGLVLGGFYETNESPALYNGDFHPFTPPVPFLLMRHTVVSDWKFFLNDPAWLNRWAHRFEDSAVSALADELRRLPWRKKQP